MQSRHQRILHVDGDSFFASCEMALDPKLKDKPVFVGGGRRGDGIVIAANYRAKAYGIITGMALNSFFVFWGIGLSFWPIVIGHATFCIVIVYNNVIARLRRLPNSFAEASADLGAGPWRTFADVLLPLMLPGLANAFLIDHMSRKAQRRG